MALEFRLRGGRLGPDRLGAKLLRPTKRKIAAVVPGRTFTRQAAHYNIGLPCAGWLVPPNLLV
jgi:hypothetical protein